MLQKMVMMHVFSHEYKYYANLCTETNTEIGTVVDNKIQTAVVFD